MINIATAEVRAQYRDIMTGIAFYNENKLRITGTREIIPDALKCEKIPIAANHVDYRVTVL